VFLFITGVVRNIWMTTRGLSVIHMLIVLYLFAEIEELVTFSDQLCRYFDEIRVELFICFLSLGLGPEVIRQRKSKGLHSL